MPTHRPRCVVAVFGPGSRFLLAEGKCARPEITGGPCPLFVICGNVTENPKEEPGCDAPGVLRSMNHGHRRETVSREKTQANRPGEAAELTHPWALCYSESLQPDCLRLGADVQLSRTESIPSPESLGVDFQLSEECFHAAVSVSGLYEERENRGSTRY